MHELVQCSLPFDDPITDGRELAVLCSLLLG
jgi:hypothetical protein